MRRAGSRKLPGRSAWLAAALVLAGGCSDSQERRKMIEEHIDADWFRRSAVDDNIARWLAAAATPSGFLRAELDRQWRPAAKQQATLVSQSRLLYVFAAGYELTGEQRYLQAVRRGADFLLEHFRDAEHEGWFWSVGPDGQVQGTHKDSYGHAFVIFGLSHAARVSGEPRYARAALETWEVMKRHFRDEIGGFYRTAGADWSRRRGHSQNPMMHLFEALLALHDATDSDAVFADAAALAEFIFTRLYRRDGGYLPEQYDASWRPLPAGKGGFADVGHQFEWAFLLARAVEKGFPRTYLDVGGRLLDFGMRVGYDAEAGGILARADYDGSASGGKGWWQQAEHLRALAHYAGRLGRNDLWPAFEKSLAFVRRELIDAEHGGWYGSAWTGEGPRPARAARKGNVWKVGYHSVGMYAEVLRVAGGR